MGRLNVVLDYLRAFASDQRGATAAEYAILLGVIGSALAMSAMYLGDAIAVAFQDTADLFAELIDKANCNNNGGGAGDGGGRGGGGGRGAGSGAGNTC